MKEFSSFVNLKFKPFTTAQPQAYRVAFGLGAWIGFYGPAHLPRPIVVRLNNEIEKILLAPDLAERWLSMLGYNPSPGTPEEFARINARDREVWKKVIADGMIKVE